MCAETAHVGVRRSGPRATSATPRAADSAELASSSEVAADRGDEDVLPGHGRALVEKERISEADPSPVA